MSHNKRRNSARTKADRLNEIRYNDFGDSEEEAQETYEVEAILQKKIKGGVEHYLVSWKGYPRSQATWQPKSNMTDCSSLILEFELAHLPQQAKDDLAETEAEEPFKPNSDPLPPNIYEHNLNAIRPHSTLDRCDQQLDFLRRRIEQQSYLPPNAEVQEIIDCDREQGEMAPTEFGIRLRGGQLRRVRKEQLLKENKLKLVEYYEKLIEWST